MGGDQRRLFRPDHMDIGAGQDVVDRAREIEADEEGGEKRVEGPDEPRPKLDQMVHQRRLGGVDVLLAHSAALCLAAGASSTACVA